MTDYVLKVEPGMFPPDQPAKVRSQYGAVDKIMRLPDEARWQMAGERVAFFNAVVEDKKITFAKRVPDPKWDDQEDIYAYMWP